MGITSRKKRPLNRKVGHWRDTRLIIIATEGSHTEKQYFSSLFYDHRVQVRVLPTGGDGKSSPEYVLGRLSDYKQEYQIGDNDELWLVADVDRWGHKKLKGVAQSARQLGINLAISNPCFEVWLLCHHQECDENIVRCDEVCELLRGCLGEYNKSKIDIHKYAEHIMDAVRRAEKNDKYHGDRWPSGVGTHVYRLVKRLLSYIG